MAVKKISKIELVEMIENLEADDAILKEYLMIDPANSNGFDIAFKANHENILNLQSAEKGLLGSLNKRSRKKRLKKYKKKIRKGFDGIKIVAEGDSWFQYPVFLKDVIDCLNDNKDMAVRSLGYGGDWLANIFREAEYIRVIREERPDVFIISGGGNDTVGENRLASMLHPYSSERNVNDYVNAEGEKVLKDIESLFIKIFTNLEKEFPKLPIICHGYDYAIPKKGSWLGAPMEQRGIKSSKLKKDIMHNVMDRFNETLIRVQKNFKNVHYVDLRGTLKSSKAWHDELHPKNSGYKKVAKIIEAKIRKVVK